MPSRSTRPTGPARSASIANDEIAASANSTSAAMSRSRSARASAAADGCFCARGRALALVERAGLLAAAARRPLDERVEDVDRRRLVVDLRRAVATTFQGSEVSPPRLTELSVNRGYSTQASCISATMGGRRWVSSPTKRPTARRIARSRSDALGLPSRALSRAFAASFSS